MEHFDWQTPTRVVFGEGALTRLGELAAACDGSTGTGRRRVLVVSDAGVVAAGHAARGIAALEAAGLRPFLFDGVEENPTTEHVDRGVAVARRHDIELIVGLGGGSSMDCAKGINFLLTQGGRMQDYWGVGKATRPMLPLVAVPTTAGTGSEAQSFALIADADTHQKMACGDKKAAARVALLDPELSTTQPPAVTAATGLDAIAHAVESYVCTRATRLSRMFAAEAWRLLSAAFERVLSAPADRGARSAMLLGAHWAGAAIENSMLGAAHACANPLTARCGMTHGLAVSVMLPHVVRFNHPAAEAAYSELAATTSAAGTLPGGRRGEPATAPMGAEAIAGMIERFLQAAGVSRRLRDHGVPQATLPALAESAAWQWTAGFNPRPAAAAELAALYGAAW